MTSFGPAKDYRVDLDIFRGPLDLLLYLVRQHEVDVVDIPVAVITDQFLGYIEVLKELDVDSIGEFIEMASTLVEIKSREILPRGGEVEEELEDPREDLVRQLLEYKKYRDAASMLEERGRDWQLRYERTANDVDERRRDLASEPIKDLELWDLVSAFGRIARRAEAVKPANIVYDETPIHVYMRQIQDRLIEHSQTAFSDLFVAGMHRSTMVSLFLAVLELVRHHGVRVEQNALFGEIWLIGGSNLASVAPTVDTATNSGDAGNNDVSDGESSADSSQV
ncbi:MAG: segregation/condensation protein A [Pirellulales bacterium]|nr:segregation/condensation protein A [Planctomycetales bacterium]